MSYKIISMVCFFCMLTAANANAETFRQSTGKGLFSIDLSYEDYEIDNKITSSNSVVPATWNASYHAPVDRKVLMLRGSYGVIEQLDVFAGIGYSDETWNAKRKDTGANFRTQSGEDPIYEIGIKGTALEFMQNKIYLAYLAKYSYLKTGDGYEGAVYSSKEAIWKEYDVDLEIGYRKVDIGLTSYVGLSYLTLEAEQNLDNDKNEYENVDDFSFFVGLNKEISDKVSINAEGTFGAKEGFKLTAKYAF